MVDAKIGVATCIKAEPLSDVDLCETPVKEPIPSTSSRNVDQSFSVDETELKQTGSSPISPAASNLSGVDDPEGLVSLHEDHSMPQQRREAQQQHFQPVNDENRAGQNSVGTCSDNCTDSTVTDSDQTLSDFSHCSMIYFIVC